MAVRPGDWTAGDWPMDNALLIGLSRQMALAARAGRVANNIANVDTDRLQGRARCASGIHDADQASADAFDGPDQPVYYVIDDGVRPRLRPGRAAAHRQPARHRHRAARASRGADRRRASATPATARFQLDSTRPAGHQRRPCRCWARAGPITFSAAGNATSSIGQDGTISHGPGVKGKLSDRQLRRPDGSSRTTGNNLFAARSNLQPARRTDVRVESRATVEQLQRQARARDHPPDRGQPRLRDASPR